MKNSIEIIQAKICLLIIKKEFKKAKDKKGNKNISYYLNIADYENDTSYFYELAKELIKEKFEISYITSDDNKNRKDWMQISKSYGFKKNKEEYKIDNIIISDDERFLAIYDLKNNCINNENKNSKILSYKKEKQNFRIRY